MPFIREARVPCVRLMLLAVCLGFPAPALHAQRVDGREQVFYFVDRPDAFDSFTRNIKHVSVIAPQSFSVAANGDVKGSVDARVLTLARRHRIPVMPVIVNPNWNRDLIHQVLVNPRAQERVTRQLVELGERAGFWGWQLDFENVAPADRQLLTQLFRETAAALHAKGMKLSIAVPVAHNDTAAGAYDMRALAAAGDFVSIMTYDQHTSDTPPGPVAGVPWMEHTIRQLLRQGVEREKLSLGIPFFSMHWFTAVDSTGKRKAAARGLGYPRADSLLQRFKPKLLWHEVQQTHYATWENGGAQEHLYIEDARSFEAKLALVAKYRLRGISVWRIGQEDPRVWRAR